jgi:hypothetical protein
MRAILLGRFRLIGTLHCHGPVEPTAAQYDSCAALFTPITHHSPDSFHSVAHRRRMARSSRAETGYNSSSPIKTALSVAPPCLYSASKTVPRSRGSSQAIPLQSRWNRSNEQPIRLGASPSGCGSWLQSGAPKLADRGFDVLPAREARSVALQAGFLDTLLDDGLGEKAMRHHHVLRGLLAVRFCHAFLLLQLE